MSSETQDLIGDDSTKPIDPHERRGHIEQRTENYLLRVFFLPENMQGQGRTDDSAETPCPRLEPRKLHGAVTAS